ncbi:MAG: hypothetical protein DMG40_09655 [Acidobacteria bacterium]|nr:MAG: hypothetical protein DMG40_09655 [Acidobacteriota bacterium]
MAAKRFYGLEELPAAYAGQSWYLSEAFKRPPKGEMSCERYLGFFPWRLDDCRDFLGRAACRNLRYHARLFWFGLFGSRPFQMLRHIAGGIFRNGKQPGSVALFISFPAQGSFGGDSIECRVPAQLNRPVVANARAIV